MKMKFSFLYFFVFFVAFAKPFTEYPMLDRYLKEDPIEALYVEAKDLHRYKVSFVEGGRVFVGGKAVESNSLTFAMDKDGNIYASPDKLYLHHSSYLRGQKVSCAGHFFLNEGVIATVMNSSGHYAPPAQSLLSVAEEFLERGLDVENISFLPVQVDEVKNIQAEIKLMVLEKKKEAKIKAKGCRSILDQILG